MAKQAASLDFMSNGRFMLGVGIGWLREELTRSECPSSDAEPGLMICDGHAQNVVWRGSRTRKRFCVMDKFQTIPAYTKSFLSSWAACRKIFQRTAQLGNGWFAPTGDPAERRATWRPQA